MAVQPISFGATALIALTLASPLGAQPASPPPPAPSTSASPQNLTGKERLGEKWKDEQRLDNCKVPPDRRGARPRPDSCPHMS